MSLKELEALMEYLDRDSVIENEGKGICLFFQAYASMAFFLWAR